MRPTDKWATERVWTYLTPHSHLAAPLTMARHYESSRLCSLIKHEQNSGKMIRSTPPFSKRSADVKLSGDWVHQWMEDWDVEDHSLKHNAGKQTVHRQTLECPSKVQFKCHIWLQSNTHEWTVLQPAETRTGLTGLSNDALPVPFARVWPFAMSSWSGAMPWKTTPSPNQTYVMTSKLSSLETAQKDSRLNDKYHNMLMN